MRRILLIVVAVLFSAGYVHAAQREVQRVTSDVAKTRMMSAPPVSVVAEPGVAGTRSSLLNTTTAAVAKNVKIRAFKGTVSGVVGGKSVVDYFGGCGKIVLTVEMANHTKSHPLTCEAVPSKNVCSFKELLDDPDYYSVKAPSPAGYMAQWGYNCSFPGLNDRTCDVMLKDVVALDNMPKIAKPVFSEKGGAAQAPKDGPNLTVSNLVLNNQQDIYGPHIVGKVLNGIYKVRNAGNQPSPDATVRFDLAKNVWGEWPSITSGVKLHIPPLAPGGEHTITFKTPVTGCDDGIKAVIDPDHEIVETKKDDNISFRAFSDGPQQNLSNCFADEAAYQAAFFPALEVYAVHFKKVQSGLVPDEIDYTVVNNNDLRSKFPKTKAALFVNGQKIHENNVDKAGDYYFPLLNPQCGQQYTVVVDPDGQVQEINKNDNSKVVTLLCP